MSQDTNQNRDFLEPNVLARLRALPFHSRMPMMGSVPGMHRRPHRGSSLEFAEYRKAVKRYIAGLKTIVRNAAVDYNRVSIGEHYGDVLARFLLERAPTKK